MKYKSGTCTRKHLVLFSASPFPPPKTVLSSHIQITEELPVLYINTSADGTLTVSSCILTVSSTDIKNFLFV